MCINRIGGLLAGLALAGLMACGGGPRPAPAGVAQGSQRSSFGGAYEDLAPEQRALIEDLVERFRRLSGQQFIASELWSLTRLSNRTTFDAVTHALLTTELSDESGQRLGTALDLVDFVDEVAGERKGLGGDRQFRLYVHLKPDAIELLERSQQFKRGSDNTRYHKGFPINYRQQGGAPSVQISVARDQRRADIDVDYRSSKFPVALFNGHLSVANSDVRAGNNADRHESRWQGLGAWWRGLLGFAGRTPEDTEGLLPAVPRVRGDSGVEAAVSDFLNAWLVEGRPQLSTAYFSFDLAACAQLGGDPGEERGSGLFRWRFISRMLRVNEQIGAIDGLPAAIEAVEPWNQRFRVIEHSLSDAFLLFEMPEDLAFAYDCQRRAGFVEETGTRPSTRLRGDYGAAFRFKQPDDSGSLLTLLLIWTKQDGDWKLISLDREEEAGPGLELDVAAEQPKPEGRPQQVRAEPSLAEAVASFWTQWMVRGDIDGAVAYIAEEALACVGQDDPELPRALPPARARARMHRGMREARDAVGPRTQLDDAVRGVELWDPTLREVVHPYQQAFTLIAIPDGTASGLVCRQEVPPRADLERMGEGSVYGNYYISLNELQVPGEPAALYLLWAQRGGEWKIVYWKLDTA